jgi:putative addiction module killer protein
MKIVRKRVLEIYVTEGGRQPFTEWLDPLPDKNVRYRIKERLDRVALGNLGDCKSLSEGIAELRFAFGSGYRVYFGEKGRRVVLLLCGGDKSTQKKDIARALSYWNDYLKR